MVEAGFIFILIAVVCFAAARAIKVNDADNGFVRFIKFIFRAFFISIGVLLALVVLRTFMR